MAKSTNTKTTGAEEMTIDYSAYLTDETKRNILQQRLANFAAEAWQHELNKKAYLEAGNEQGVEQSDAAIALLSSMIASHQAELNLLAPEPAE